jgi:hypothetical protein
VKKNIKILDNLWRDVGNPILSIVYWQFRFSYSFCEASLKQENDDRPRPCHGITSFLCDSESYVMFVTDNALCNEGHCCSHDIFLFSI